MGFALFMFFAMLAVPIELSLKYSSLVLISPGNHHAMTDEVRNQGEGITMKKFMMALAIPALLIGCGKEDKPQKPSEIAATPAPDVIRQARLQNLIMIRTADNKAVANAQVLIGDALDTPFSGNFLTADELGQLNVPTEWATAAAVTVQAEGFVRSTYLAQEPGPLVVVLRPMPQKQQYELRGVANNLPVVDKDGFIDFALLMPAFTRLDILNFDLTKIISAQMDKISTLGQEMSIPANISLPKQEEKYSLFTATLDKPQYRLYLNQPGPTRLFATRGRFPFKSTADAIRGGASFIDILNDIKIQGGAVRDLDVKNPQTSVNMPTRELNFTGKKDMIAPAGIRADEMFIAVGVANQAGYMIPTDFRRMTAGQKASLGVLPDSEQLLLGALAKEAELKNGGSRLSAALVPFVSGTVPKVLPLIPDPSVRDNELSIPQFNTIDGVNPTASYFVLSTEEQVTQGAARIKVFFPQWEVYSDVWLFNVKMPQWPGDSPIAGKKRWEANYVGSQTASQAPVGPAMIDSATHVTHSAVSF